MMALTPVLHGWLETLKTSVGIDHKLKGRDYSTFNAEIQDAVGLSPLGTTITRKLAQLGLMIADQESTLCPCCCSVSR
jgi:hypothetical protein